MTLNSPLINEMIKGSYGNNENNEVNLITIKEKTNIHIFQIAQYKNSSFDLDKLKIDDLEFPRNTLEVKNNNNVRILWVGPKNWLLILKSKDLISKLDEIDKNKPVIVMCHSGGRSARVCVYLAENGYDATNLAGGINSWSINIDPSVPQY